jgi:undecaprenyl-diphosphatase
VDALLELEREIVAWLNQGIGRSYLLDRATYLVVSDYFIPLMMCFWGLGIWFHGKDARARERNQKAVLAAAISLGFANLLVLVVNQFVFRERPFVHHELANLLYAPTDSSFPANPAAVAFAMAMGVWLKNRRASAPLFFLAALWSFARVYNGLFYPSDVAAAGLTGVAVACLVTLGLRAVEPLPTRVLKGARLLHLA